MGILDWLLLALVALAAAAAVRVWRKSGSCGCGNDCAHCSGVCSECRKHKK